MLGSLRSSLSLSKKLSRGYLSQGRQQKKDAWWSVDGEIFKAEEFDPKRVLEPSPNEQISNKKRRKDRLRQLTLTRLKLRNEGQESYWAAYMRRYQIMRDEWEKLVWDPMPIPQPKSRNPSLVRNDAERYVWRDPRRDSYGFQDSQDSRMARHFSSPNFYAKSESSAKTMDRYPYGGQRNAGTTVSKFGAPYQSHVNKGSSYESYADGHKAERGFNAYKNRAGSVQQTSRMYRHEEIDRNDKYEIRSRGWSKDDRYAKGHNHELNSWSEDSEDDKDFKDNGDSDDEGENNRGRVKHANNIFGNKERVRNDKHEYNTSEWSEEDVDEFDSEEDDDD